MKCKFFDCFTSKLLLPVTVYINVQILQQLFSIFHKIVFKMASILPFSVVSILICVMVSITNVKSANILFLLPIATKSHKNCFDPLIEALAERDHNITVVAPLKFKTPLPNVREIVPVPFSEINPYVTSGDPFERRKEGKIGFFLNWDSSFLEGICDKLYRNEEILEMLKTDSYDVIIVNTFMNGCSVGMVHALQAPHIYLITMPGMNAMVQKTGLYFPPSFVPNSFAPFSDRMSFKERVLNFIAEYFMIINAKLSWNHYLSKMYQDHLGEDFPTISEIDKNVSLILMNSHFSMTYPRPLLPDVVEVGGMHTRPGLPLPKDLDDFVSGAKDGFILFSLGSIVQAKDMPVDVKNRFLNVFSRLKQRVVWKWEGEIPANVSSNVKLSKWLPQQDLLAHPNIKIFITHGGLLSIQEAAYHGTPLIGFPLFADQDLNMKQAEKAGFAVTLEINEFTEEKLESTINRILTEKGISDRAKQLSTVFRDQPHRPIETAIYWVEYIIRHKGAPHLRSSGRYLNFIAYHSIDVIAFLSIITFLAIWAAYRICLALLKCYMTHRESSRSRNTFKQFHKNK